MRSAEGKSCVALDAAVAIGRKGLPRAGNTRCVRVVMIRIDAECATMKTPMVMEPTHMHAARHAVPVVPAV